MSTKPAQQTTAVAAPQPQALVVGNHNQASKALADMKSRIEPMLPGHIDFARFKNSIVLAVVKQPKLQECSLQSLFLSALEAAKLGLDPSGGTLGEGYLIPFKGEVQFIPGYRGLITLARRSNDIADIYAELVYEADYFVIEYGTDRKLVHKPPVTGDRGKTIGAYCVTKLKDGTHSFTYMTKAEILRIRDNSNGWKQAKKFGNSSPWDEESKGGSEGEMMRKTVFRRHIKTQSISTEDLRKALELDDKDYSFGDTGAKVQLLPTQSRKEQFAAAIGDRVPNPPQSADEVSEDEAERIEQEGRDAYKAGKPIEECPYATGYRREVWETGWNVQLISDNQDDIFHAGEKQ